MKLAVKSDESSSATHRIYHRVAVKNRWWWGDGWGSQERQVGHDSMDLAKSYPKRSKQHDVMHSLAHSRILARVGDSALAMMA